MIYCIRSLVQADLDAVRALESETLSPWHPDSDRNSSSAVELVMHRSDGELVGWCCCRLVRPEAELLKISVVGASRGLGLGTVLLHALIEILTRQGCSELFLEVRGANLAAVRLYRRCGFQQVGLRRRYYTAPVDDAVLMKLDLE